MSTGTWIASFLVILVLNPRRVALLPSLPEAADALLAAQWSVFWLLLVALLILMITGGFMTRYWKEKAKPAELPQRLRLLWIKHLLFAVVYGGGTLWAWIIIR